LERFPNADCVKANFASWRGLSNPIKVRFDNGTDRCVASTSDGIIEQQNGL
jgi:hypothetical protein